METNIIPKGTTLKWNGMPLGLLEDTEVEMGDANFRLASEPSGCVSGKSSQTVKPLSDNQPEQVPQTLKDNVASGDISDTKNLSSD